MLKVPKLLWKMFVQIVMVLGLVRVLFGVSKIPNTLPQEEILKKLRGYKSGTLSQYGMGNTMMEQLANFSDDDLVALSKYVPSLKR